MIIFAWNCRSIGKASTIRDLRALMRSSSPDCLILMETKANQASMNHILSQLHFPNSVYVPPIGLAGGFCVAWREGFDMEPIIVNKHLISLIIFNTSGVPPWMISAVYGPTASSAKRRFWDSIHSKVDRFPGPWMLIGYFNGILYSSDCSSNRGINGGSSFMREALDNLGMISIPSSGFHYTGFNCRHGRSQINLRINRVVANEDWWNQFPNASIQLLLQTTSDHSPQVLRCLGQNAFVKRSFLFEAAWVEDPRSYWVVNHAWCSLSHPRPTSQFLNKIQTSRVFLLHWNKSHFGNIQANIKATREARAKTQHNMNATGALDRDRNLRLHLDHLLKIEEIMWHQKSDLKWQSEEGRCPRFFFLSTLT
ncbi:hypothetical protein UlMin_014584 [Ulmus minor]